MEQEIQDIISRQLPAQVGDVLRKRLEQADSDAVKVKSLESEVRAIREQNVKQHNEIGELKSQIAMHHLLDVREAAATKREQSIELEICKARADNAERSKGELFNLVGLVFRNSIVKESISKSHYDGSVGRSVTGTVTREVCDGIS